MLIFLSIFEKWRFTPILEGVFLGMYVVVQSKFFLIFESFYVVIQ